MSRLADGIDYVLLLSSNLSPIERKKLQDAAEVIRLRAPAAEPQSLPPEVAAVGWIPVSERVPKGGDYYVLTWHPEFGIHRTHVGSVRIWAHPEDTSMRAAMWQPLPADPLEPQGSVQK